MVKILDRVPSAVVIISGSDEITSPCNDQDICNGSSPVTTEQMICENVPSFTVSDGNWKFAMKGGSVKEYERNLSHSSFDKGIPIDLFPSHFNFSFPFIYH